MVGYLRAVQGTKLALADNVEQNLREADAAATAFKSAVDEHVRATVVDAPEEDVTHLLDPGRWRPKDSISELHLRAAGITSAIWCTGYQDDYGWVKLPIFDQAGNPIQGLFPRPEMDAQVEVCLPFRCRGGCGLSCGADGVQVVVEQRTAPLIIFGLSPCSWRFYDALFGGGVAA
jgi:hypothetical protein